jgi:hypothetical protein
LGLLLELKVYYFAGSKAEKEIENDSSYRKGKRKIG